MSWLRWCLFAIWLKVNDAAGCFTPDTKVTMADGSRRMIGGVQIGEWVTSWNEDKQVAVPAKVLNVKRTMRLDLMQVKCGNQPVIISTRDHPYWSVQQNSLISADPATTQVNYGLEAKSFLDNELLQDVDGSAVKCEVVSRADSAQLREVLTLQLEDHHWFFVEGIRVHNKGGGGCFVLSTLVTMADNSIRAIGEVKVGDTVMSWDEQKQIAAPAKVLKIKRAKRSDLLKVRLESGALITSTRDHPFWSLKQGSLVSADPENTKWGYDLPANTFLDDEVLQAVNGSAVACQVVSRENSAQLEDVMTLFLEGHHWFFVEGVRVHNKGASCFLPTTIVTMADEQPRALGEVQIGDSVLSWDEAKNVATSAKVLNIKRAQRSDMLHVTLQSGPIIVSTADHPFWSLKQGSLISADPEGTRLNYGLLANQFHDNEVLQAPNGSGIACKTKLVKSEELLDVMTLELQDHHWFFAEGVRVHNKGTSSSGSTGTASSRTSGGFRGTQSGVYYSTYVPFYPVYYSHSPYCGHYPSQPQCGSNDDIECGCSGTSDDASTYARYCPPADLKGSCWLYGQSTSCVPTSPQMSVNDSRYLDATTFCAEFIQNCTGSSECANEMLLNNFSSGVLYWTNVSEFFPENASDSFLALSQCMTSQIKFCQCAWETCEVGLSTGFLVGVILGPILGVIFLGLCIWYACVKCKVHKKKKRNPLIDSCKHLFEALPCSTVAKRTGNNTYLEGFICDVCSGSFSANINPTHCFQCGLDFCDGCLAAMGGGTQELPQYNEPSCAACLANPSHAASVSETRCEDQDESYATGFICDSCHGKFSPEVPFQICSLCVLDFCAGCSIRRVKPGESPPLELVPPPSSEESAPWPDTDKPPPAFDSPQPTHSNGYNSL
jgi:hypothetical protein